MADMGEVDGVPVVAVDHNEDGSIDVTLANGTRFMGCWLKSHIPPPSAGDDCVIQEIHLDTKDIKLDAQAFRRAVGMEANDG